SGPDGNTADVVGGRVDRVDDPAARAPACRTHLLTDDGVPRPGALERTPDGLLGGLVGVGYHRRVVLDADLQVTGAEALHRLGVCAVREDVGEPEVVVIGHSWST